MSPAPLNDKAARFAPKPKAARPAPTAEQRRTYLAKRLASQVADGHLAKGLKTVDQLIALGPSPSLTATKLSFLLHLDRYAAALDLLGSLGPAEQATLTFERAYGLYRLGREAEAKEVIDKAVADGHQLGEGAEFLQAQLAYRAHDYELATELYASLLPHYPADHPAHADLAQNQALAQRRADFARSGYHDALASAEGAEMIDADSLEEEVPVLPAAAASSSTAGRQTNAKAGPSSAGATAKKVKTSSAGKEPAGAGAKKRRHALPKGAIDDGKAFSEDPDRWLPLRARASNPKSASYNPNYTSGTSMSNIASSGAASPPPAAAGGKKKAGGGKKKAGKK